MAQQKALVSFDVKTGLALFITVRRLQDNRWYDYATKTWLDAGDVTNQYTPLIESTLSESTYTCELEVDASQNGEYNFKIFSLVGTTYEPISNEVVKNFYNGLVTNKNDNELLAAQIIIDGFAATASMISEANADTGVVTSSAAQTELSDTAKSWQVDMWKDSVFSVLTSVDSVEHIGHILSNTADTLTFSDIGVAIAVGDTYQIKLKVNSTSIRDVNGTAQTARDWSEDFRATAPGNTSVIKRVVVAASTEGTYTLPNNTRSYKVIMEDGLPGESFYVSLTTGVVTVRTTDDYTKVEGNIPVGDDNIDMVTGIPIYFATDKVGGSTFVILATYAS